MEAKKNPDLDLNHNSSLYFSIGLCLMLFVTNSLLNFKTYDKEDTIAEILEMVDQLQAADTANVEPMANPLDAVQRLRADAVTEGNRREAFQAIAPAVENGLYLVPKVIE